MVRTHGLRRRGLMKSGMGETWGFVTAQVVKERPCSAENVELLYTISSTRERMNFMEQCVQDISKWRCVSLRRRVFT